MSEEIILDDGSVLENPEGLESCVSCGGETDVQRKVHIDSRVNYVSGIGQFCDGCYIFPGSDERELNQALYSFHEIGIKVTK